MVKQVKLRGKTFYREQWPLICTPLVAADIESLVSQAKSLINTNPDIIEWRIDFFAELSQTDKVVAALKQIRQTIGEVPLLVTRRSINEGGEPIELDEAAVLELYLRLLETRAVDAIDYEIALSESYWQTLVSACQEAKVLLIGSYHNFDRTPRADDILGKLQQAEALGANIAKAALMPASLADVLTVLAVTDKADQLLSIPVITMSMAELGLSTRLMGSVFGSCLTFAVGAEVSAPGQVPVDDVKAVVSVIQKYQ